jgi:hypothetical protein
LQKPLNEFARWYAYLYQLRSELYTSGADWRAVATALRDECERYAEALSAELAKADYGQLSEAEQEAYRDVQELILPQAAHAAASHEGLALVADVMEAGAREIRRALLQTPSDYEPSPEEALAAERDGNPLPKSLFAAGPDTEL